MNDLYVGFGAGQGPQAERLVIGRWNGNPLASAGEDEITWRKHRRHVGVPRSSTSSEGGASPGASGRSAIVKPSASAAVRAFESTGPIEAAVRCARHASGSTVP
jgi:hypothetical protein